jgi:2-furoyl-CoA dehydrogenase 2Fe-2S iron sulfur subunit
LLTGHLCRCTGYTPIVRAALEAAAEMSGDVSREKSDA